MKIERISVNLEWIDDPDASDYQMPCDGCPDFCDREDTDEATGDDFGEAQCVGQTHIRRTTVWQAILQFTWRAASGMEIRTAMTGIGQSEDEALNDAQTRFVAARLRDDEDDWI